MAPGTRGRALRGRLEVTGADDMQLWAAIGTKFVRKAVREPGRRYARYSMNKDGSVAVSDA